MSAWVEIARIVEDDKAEYRWRCIWENCIYHPGNGDEDSLSIAMTEGRMHAIHSGHTVIVERRDA